MLPARLISSNGIAMARCNFGGLLPSLNPVRALPYLYTFYIIKKKGCPSRPTCPKRFSFKWLDKCIAVRTPSASVRHRCCVGVQRCNSNCGVLHSKRPDNLNIFVGWQRKCHKWCIKSRGRTLEHLPTLRGHSMGQSGSFGQARRAARCGSSGKRRNAADEPLWPTKGRVLLSRGRVALLIR